MGEKQNLRYKISNTKTILIMCWPCFPEFILSTRDIIVDITVLLNYYRDSILCFQNSFDFKHGFQNSFVFKTTADKPLSHKFYVTNGNKSSDALFLMVAKYFLTAKTKQYYFLRKIRLMCRHKISELPLLALLLKYQNYQITQGCSV